MNEFVFWLRVWLGIGFVGMSAYLGFCWWYGNVHFAPQRDDMTLLPEDSTAELEVVEVR